VEILRNIKRRKLRSFQPIVLVTHDTDIAGHARRQIRLKDGKVLTDEKVGEAVPV